MVFLPLKNETALTDDDLIAVGENLLNVNRAVDKDVIYAAKQLAILNIAVDHLEARTIGHDERVFSRHTAVIEDDIVLLRPADRDGLTVNEIRGPYSPGWFSDCYCCFQGNVIVIGKV